MKLVRREEVERKPIPYTQGGVYWKDTQLGIHIINDMAHHFTKGRDVPMDGTRFTAVAKDGMLYYNDNAEELKAVLYMIDRWILQDRLDFLLNEENE